MDKKEQILHYYRVDGLSLREITERRKHWMENLVFLFFLSA